MILRSWSCQMCGRKHSYLDPDPSPSLGGHRWAVCEECNIHNELVYSEVGRGWRSTGRVTRDTAPDSTP